MLKIAPSPSNFGLLRLNVPSLGKNFLFVYQHSFTSAPKFIKPVVTSQFGCRLGLFCIFLHQWSSPGTLPTTEGCYLYTYMEVV
jgi:hypothetical protein